MDKNIVYAVKRGHGFPVILRLDQIKLLLEAFTNWADTGHDQWNDKGQHIDPDIRNIISILEHKVTALGG